MARRIVLSELARSDRRRILEYWNKRNQSKAYSRKLNEQFSQALKLISLYPQIGKQTDDQNLRVKIVSHYLIFYEMKKDTIYVLTIWDSRRDPKELEKIVR